LAQALAVVVALVALEVDLVEVLEFQAALLELQYSELVVEHHF
jgi:hypothetical protein